MNQFKSFNVDSFKSYLSSLSVKRNIKLIQLHHTYGPCYKQFTGTNHQTLQKNMRDYHINTNGWADIGQHFTIFPDGVILSGRSIEKIPAGIKGANTGAICIECVGNFDIGGDTMSEAQKNAIIGVVKLLLDKFNLDAKTSVIYHAWWTAAGTALGTYVRGKSCKTCPGTNFFGGNTKEAYENNLLPLILNHGKEEKKMPETKRYDYIDDNMPGWAKPTITKLVTRGHLNGDENGKLNLSEDMLRMFVVNDRAGLYDRE